ncbi:hypothetical protein [Brevundimonas goettingensis]|uniref:DUF4329 domain-containing protein n=1 Tax=Brevundimonas goettingensis TaxID=2774190 RepID=A0A975GXD5_9CAUL|nr:hypothetical protein [Brevundimonas goettingensis]QTC92813.1 hypothetical protein IFJ75_08195 [Brevundimonas goettingensis]
MTDTTYLGEILVTGTRRAHGSTGGYGGSAGGPRDTGGIHQDEVSDNPNPEPPVQNDPCADALGQFEVNADAAAAKAAKDMEEFAKGHKPNETPFNEREYFTALWQLPDGSFDHGPITTSEETFSQPGGGDQKPSPDVDFTPPVAGAVLVGSVHSHGPLGWVMSTGPNHPNGEQSGPNSYPTDQDHLSGMQAMRAANGGDRNQTKLYIVARDSDGSYEIPGTPRLHVYDQRNREAAIGGGVGPEVDPEAQPCPNT